MRNQKGGVRLPPHTGDHGSVWPFKDPEDPTPNYLGNTVDFRAYGVAVTGLKGVKTPFRTCMEAFGINYVETQLRVTRADFAVDFLAPWFEPNRECLILPPGTKSTEYTGVNETETVSSGSIVVGLRTGAVANRQPAIYDKLAEIIQTKQMGWLTIWYTALKGKGLPPLDLKERDATQFGGSNYVLAPNNYGIALRCVAGRMSETPSERRKQNHRCAFATPSPTIGNWLERGRRVRSNGDSVCH